MTIKDTEPKIKLTATEEARLTRIHSPGGVVRDTVTIVDTSSNSQPTGETDIVVRVQVPVRQ